MANTFFKAKGYGLGNSLVEDTALDTARSLMQKGGAKLVLPVDGVIGDKFADDAKTQTIKVEAGVPAGWGMYRLLAERGPAQRRDQLVSVLAHPRAAERLGTLYLEIFPEERSLDQLVDAIDASLAGNGRSAPSATGLVARLRARIRRDFEEDRVRIIDGWLLSVTELRLAALAAL